MKLIDYSRQKNPLHGNDGRTKGEDIRDKFLFRLRAKP
jgi:hypothetical protein